MKEQSQKSECCHNIQTVPAQYCHDCGQYYLIVPCTRLCCQPSQKEGEEKCKCHGRFDPDSKDCDCSKNCTCHKFSLPEKGQLGEEVGGPAPKASNSLKIQQGEKTMFEPPEPEKENELLELKDDEKRLLENYKNDAVLSIKNFRWRFRKDKDLSVLIDGLLFSQEKKSFQEGAEMQKKKDQILMQKYVEHIVREEGYNFLSHQGELSDEDYEAIKKFIYP